MHAMTLGLLHVTTMPRKGDALYSMPALRTLLCYAQYVAPSC